MHLLRQLLWQLTLTVRLFQEQDWCAGLMELGRTLSRILYLRGEYVIMANDLSGLILLPGPGPDLVVRRVETREELDGLRSIASLADLSRYCRMFDHGSSVFIALQNDQPVGYGWISQMVDRSVHGVQPPLRPGDVCLHDLFVSPAHRRQGIGQMLIAHRLRFLRDNGYRRAIIAVKKDNIPSLEANRKTGYVPVGEMSHTRFLFWDRLTHNVLGPRELRPAKPGFSG